MWDGAAGITCKRRTYANEVGTESLFAMEIQQKNKQDLFLKKTTSAHVYLLHFFKIVNFF